MGWSGVAFSTEGHELICVLGVQMLLIDNPLKLKGERFPAPPNIVILLHCHARVL